MLIKFGNWFVKITGWLVQKLLFRTKVYYEDRNVQKRQIKGLAVIISNHTSVYDYAVCLFTFYRRTLRYQMAEILYKKKPLRCLLKMLGGIYVDRNVRNFGFVYESLDILRNGGVVGIFPEGRIPREGEKTPLEFKPSAAYIALASGAPVIPVYIKGPYFGKGRIAVIIGKPVFAKQFVKEGMTEKESIQEIAAQLRSRIIKLEKLLNEKLCKEKC